MTDFDSLAGSWTDAIEGVAQSDSQVDAKIRRPGRKPGTKNAPTQSVESAVSPSFDVVPPRDEINALVGGIMDFGTGIADVTPYTPAEKERLGNATYPVVVKYPWLFTNAPEVFLLITAVTLATPKVLEYHAKRSQQTGAKNQPVKTGVVKEL